ncbi:uncharacterized protein N7459_005990 [Penicillium hispanicum]|uniref:uncharacterized protein n=1 Tax=Penicillium hispanicum TaxID=1080232 RepID=UPI002540CBC1|nr:uncharacterized protein N7459_005990 [Penicillium hispanicum]KAJ5580005.1 hypothetical protein N7459_005990 [Penicillium hispanicum]
MASAGGRRWQQFLQELVMIAGTSVSAYFLIRHLLSRLDFDPDSQKKEESRRKAAAVLRRLDGDESDDESPTRSDSKRGARRSDLTLNHHEQQVAMGLIAPDDIPVSFEDIGGLSHTIDDLNQKVIYPLTMPHLYASASPLLRAPDGVLLYGPPGCGKTMLAKALAHESGACFLNVNISTLTDKYYGESNKFVEAVFTLARKLQPTIIFIDEIDALLSTRRSGDLDATTQVKTKFMTEWDGLGSANSNGDAHRIVVLGATNRKDAIDDAILRRFGKKIEVPLPGDEERLRILSLILKDTKIDRSEFDVPLLVYRMAGLSGSAIKDACREAAMAPVQEIIRDMKSKGVPLTAVNPDDLRGLRTSDFRGIGVQATPRPVKLPTVIGKGETEKEEADWSTESEAASEADARSSGMVEPPE